MSYYEDERVSRRRSSIRDRRRDDYDDSRYDDRDAKSSAIVRRRDDSPSSVEEVARDFPPGDRGAVYRETTVRKQGHRPVTKAQSFSNDDYYYDDRYDDKSSYGRKRDDDLYVSRRRSKYDDRDYKHSSRRHHSDSDGSSRSRSRTPPRRERRKSTTEQLLGAVGLGSVAAALTGKKDSRSRSRSRDRDRARSRRGRSTSSSRSRGERRGKSRGRDQVTEALKAALLAGVGEAVRTRKAPGGWGGEKGKRVLTAAITAGGVDGILSNNRGDKDHSTRDVLGSALAGLATNRIINGPRSKSRGRDDSADGRGRSQSRGGLGSVAAGGVLAATGKKIYDNIRSRSRGRAQSRASSRDSYDSRSPPRRARSQSVSAGLARGLSAVGLSGIAAKVEPDRRKSRSNDYYDDDRNGSYRDYRDSRDVGPLTPSPQPGYPPGNLSPAYEGPARAVSASRAPPSYALDYRPHHTGDPETDSDSDLGSSTDDEKRVKKGRKKTMLTAGLATIATIHAAHNVYQSVEKRHARKEALREGDITPDQAKRMKNKNRFQDAASIGIAALGIKGAYSEWQEMNEHNKEVREYREKMKRHKEKREARRQKAQMEAERYRQSGYMGSLPDLHVPTPPPGGYYSQDVSPFSPTPPNYSLQHQQQHFQSIYDQSTTHYLDDNPYSSFSPEPGFASINPASVHI
ncbi:hypothetical protein DV736_g337, partial [Chaetothyriales sp. CBS 134916]